MKSKRGIVLNHHRRLPRKGCVFLLSRIAGWLFKIAGALLLCFALAGFIFNLIQSGPTLIESIQYLGRQKSAGLIFSLILVNFLVFRIIGLVGIIFAAIGFAMGHIGTEAFKTKSSIEADNKEQLNTGIHKTK